MSYKHIHWIRPLKFGPTGGKHLLLYVKEDNSEGVAIPADRRVWATTVSSGNWNMRLVDSYNTTDRLDSLLDQCCAKKGETTIWLLRGWTDLVLSGLAELMDAGIIQWRYANIGGSKILIKGSWRGRKITITSLSNWTGGRWDNWGDVGEDVGVRRLMTLAEDADGRMPSLSYLEEMQALEVLAAIVSTTQTMLLPRVAPTSAAAGLMLWRAWLGSTVALIKEKGRGKKKGSVVEKDVYVAPLPNRPAKARAAERHVVYALTSRQLRKGMVEGPIYCVDMKGAYLLGLITTPLPIAYKATFNKVSNDQASDALCGHTGLGLVRIKSDNWYYPCRINGSVIPCKGRFWAWLCGSELAHAYCNNHVEETWCLHTWIGEKVEQDKVESCIYLGNMLDRAEHCATKKAWRAIYSSLVGRFAGWRKVWVDSKAVSGFGRWATWVQADPRTGEIVPYRSIAGKVQMLRSKEDMSSAVPLMFGVVTAQVRWFMQLLAQFCGYENVYNIVADSLWLSQDGWQRLQQRVSEFGYPVDNLRVKAIYDRAWMVGRAVAVAERDGVKQLILPGVLDGASIDSTGHVVMDRADDWSGQSEPRASEGVKRNKIRYHIPSIIQKYGAPATVILPGETVDIPLLNESLLQPLTGDRGIDDV